MLALSFAGPLRRRGAARAREEGMPFDGAARAREEGMPFDGIADPVVAKSLWALELMEDRLQGGRKWTRHFMFRDGGKMCLLGASYFGSVRQAGRGLVHR
jgi:hypothetical protein